ncbi:unnamed protein product [Didymodactylos carnosus]|uniref:G-protein coupled receptors family 1 profile domain-containing protein n=1 Tax=Didymodactylos carnosus TaxID=1234261 RepID=A0A8S2LDI6_9BILA|nr:unnamed protein product [Didymodactylos carnosus]CAF3896941.1 unnamed protein product [Didymodactylos carnosus]
MIQLNVTNSSLINTRPFPSWTVPYLIVLLIIGSIGNVLTVILFFQKNLRQNTCYIYFFSLALADEVALLLPSIRRIIWITYKLDVRSINNFLCIADGFFTGYSSQKAAWILAVISVDRCISIVCTGKLKYTIRKTKFIACVIITVTLLLVVVNFPHFLLRINSAKQCRGQISFSLSYTIIDLFVYTVLPFTTMIICNTIIIHKIRTLRRNLSAFKLQSSRTQGYEIQLTISMLAISTMFLFLLFPYCFMVVYQAALKSGEHIFEITALISYINHSINFYLYLIVAVNIRKEIIRLLKKFCNYFTQSDELKTIT